MRREENVKIFNDTKMLVESNEKLKEALKQSLSNQKIILEEDDYGRNCNKMYDAPAKILVSKNRTLEAAAVYKGMNIAVHNFASATNPGGGVENGANAQEECICRCSDLFFCLDIKENWDGFYNPHRAQKNPLHNDDIIYTPKVTVIKTDTSKPTLMSEDNWMEVNVITCAAPNLRSKPSNQYNIGDGDNAVMVSDKELLEIHEKRLRRILDVAVMEGNDTIILGAFGCGAFMNNPEVVASAAKNVIKDYMYMFKVIKFAVYCSPRDDMNYKVFKRIIDFN